MAFIKPVLNYGRFELKNLTSGSTEDYVELYMFPSEDSKDENIYSINNNKEQVLLDNRGDRFYLEVSLYDTDDGSSDSVCSNSQLDVNKLSTFVSFVKNGTHSLVIYPYYAPGFVKETMDKHEYIIDSSPKYKPIKTSINVGNTLTYKFKGIRPEIGYVAKIPSTGLPYVEDDIILA